MQNLIFTAANRGNRDFKDFIPFSNFNYRHQNRQFLEIPCYPTFTFRYFYFPFSSFAYFSTWKEKKLPHPKEKTRRNTVIVEDVKIETNILPSISSIYNLFHWAINNVSCSSYWFTSRQLIARKIYSSSRFGTRYSRLENTHLTRVDSRVWEKGGHLYLATKREEKKGRKGIKTFN